MLRSEELDQERFDDILTDAVSRLTEYLPAWTDHNPSDPGMAILELFAWYTEVSRYHLNVIGKNNIVRYLELLGYRVRGIIPSRTILKVSGRGRLACGSTFFAEDIPFETETSLDVQDNELVYIRSQNHTIENRNGIFDLPDHQMEIFPVYQNGQFYFEMGFRSPFPKDEVIGLYVQIRGDEEMAEIPDDFEPDVPLFLEYLCEDPARDIRIIKDDTKGLLRSGMICFTCQRMIPVNGVCRLRLVLPSERTAKPPVITGLVLNAVSAVQRQTERFSQPMLLGISGGICNLRLKLGFDNVLNDSIGICVEEPGGLFDWEQRDNFDCSDRTDRHFVFDEDLNELVFGDGENGCPPEGKIYLTDIAISYGAGGNVKKGMIESSLGDFHAKNIIPSSGGRDRETIEECYQRIRSDRKKRNRLITLKDFEEAAGSVPGMIIKRVHAFRKKDNIICICIENRDTKCLSEAQMKSIKDFILPKTLIGTKVEFPKIRYIRIHLYLEVSVNPSFEDPKEQTEKAMRQFFEGEQAGFGCLIRKNEIGRYIYTLPWIQGMKSVEISTTGSGAELMNNGDIRLDHDCLALVEHVIVNIVKLK